MSEPTYRVFHRTFWKSDGKGGLVPNTGRKTLIAVRKTYDQARDIATVWNANHEPGKFSRRAEFEKE